MLVKLNILDEAGYQYEGYCRQKLSELEKDRASKPKGAILKDVFALPGDLIAQIICTATVGIITIIKLGYSGFLCHPRIGSLVDTRFDIYSAIPSYEGHTIVAGNGNDTNGNPLPNGPFAYPLVDDDHGTRGVQLKGSTWKAVNGPPENYGNIDWKGPQGEILTWRGPPTRYFPLNPYLEIPGFTQLDFYREGVTGGDYSVFTPFGKNVYRSGRVYATAPEVNWPQSDTDVEHEGHILGAAICSGKLVIIVKATFATFSQPRSGYYYQAYVKDNGWQLLGEQGIGHIPATPFFFNASGTEAQTVDNDGSVWKATINLQALTATFTSTSSITTAQEHATTSTTVTDEAGDIRATIPQLYTYPAQGGTVAHPAWFYAWPDTEPEYEAYIAPLNGKQGEETTTNHQVAVTKSGARIIAVDYKGDTAIYAKESVSGNESVSFRRKFSAALGYGGRWGDVKYILSEDPLVHTLGEIAISEPVSVGSQATISNGCRGSWSISKGSINHVTGVITALPCVSGSEAYATITYQSALGTKTKVVRFAGGVWVSIGYLNHDGIEYMCSDCGVAGYKAQISGGYGYVYSIAWARKDDYGSSACDNCWCVPDHFAGVETYPSDCETSLCTQCDTQNAPDFGTYSCTCMPTNFCICKPCSGEGQPTFDMEPCGACYTTWISRTQYEWRCP